MKIVTICGMSEDKVRASLLPLAELDPVEKIFLVRRSPVPMAKVKSYSPPKILGWSLFLTEVYRFIALFAVCVKEKPDCIYAIYFVPHGVYAAIIGRFLNIPVIEELIGTDRPLVNKSKFYQSLLAQAERIGVRGKSSKTNLSYLGLPDEKFFISKAVNAIDFDLFQPDQTQKIFDFVYVGRLDQNKQVHLIVDASYALQQQYPDIKLLIVGDGPESSNLTDKVADYGITESVHFAGKQKYEDIPNFLNQSRVFIMASAFEGLPVAMIEALSCGLPVVMPDIGDISDIALDGYNALLIDEVSLDSYVKALSELLTNQPLYRDLVKGALKTREKFLAEYSLESVKRSWHEILLEIKA
ncbi:MAG: glycosyltransferase family 4 protein [Brevefilum sp.]|nr:glycosyltransferase family 4 protein [Brevefilum sp.]